MPKWSAVLTPVLLQLSTELRGTSLQAWRLLTWQITQILYFKYIKYERISLRRWNYSNYAPNTPHWGQSEKMVCFRFPAGWIFTEIHPVGNCVFFFSFLFFRAEFWVSTARNRNKYDISRKWKAISIQNLCLDSFWVVKLYFLCNTFT